MCFVLCQLFAISCHYQSEASGGGQACRPRRTEASTWPSLIIDSPLTPSYVRAALLHAGYCVVNLMNKAIWIVALGFALSSGSGSTVSAATVVTNGGDIVSCRDEIDAEYVGPYSLDFLLTRRSLSLDSTVEVTTWEQSAQRILLWLRAKIPALGRSFSDFLIYTYNFMDESRPRIWRPAPFGLLDLADEQIISLLPANCYVRDAAQRIAIIQSIIREQRANLIIYHFDPNILDPLRDESPLQYSFLMIHEWLWDLSRDVRVNRDVNRILHSQDLEYLPADALEQRLRNVGLDW